MLTLAEEVGPYICLLKTHIDVLSDFTNDFVNKIKDLANKHQFLIFEVCVCTFFFKNVFQITFQKKNKK